MNGPVQHAIAELEATFHPSAVVAEDDGQGGAFVVVETVELTGPYEQKETWMGFHLTGQFPYADIYPVFVRGYLQLTDNKPLGDGIGQGHNFRTRAAVQVSRKSNGRDPLIETASAKILKVRKFLETRP